MRFSDREITARLPTRCARQVKRRMISDYRDFPTRSIFRGTGQPPTRSALLTAKWRGCDSGGSLLGDPICEVLLIRVVAEVGKGKDDNRCSAAIDSAWADVEPSFPLSVVPPLEVAKPLGRRHQAAPPMSIVK